MRKPAFLLTLSISALVLAPLPASALDIFGWKPFGSDEKAATTAPSSTEEGTAAEELRRGEALENSGNTGDAVKVYRGIVKANSLTAAAPKALARIGRILERQGSYKDAFAAYSDYTAKYPRGGEFDTVIQAQFEIAKLYLNGQKKKLLGVPISTDYEKAKDMFEEIVKRAPFHKLAPLAQFNVGQALEKASKPSEALSAYQEVITRYPGDAIADDAQYQMGYVQFHAAQDGSYDQSAKLKARESFEDFVNRYPTSEKVAQAKQNIQALSGSDVKGTLEVARYYDKTKNYKAAVVYYNEVIRNAPGSTESGLAKKRIDELKSLVGVDALRSGPERAQGGDTALARRRAQALVDVASRPDFNGPPISYPYPTLNGRPAMRTTPLGPIVEPALPTGDPLQTAPGTQPTVPASGDPLIPPTLPPPPAEGAKPAEATKDDAVKTAPATVDTDKTKEQKNK